MFTPSLQHTGHQAAVYALCPYIEDRQVLSGGGDGWVVVWSVGDQQADGQLLAQVTGHIFSLAYIASLHWVVVGTMEGDLHWIDLATNKAGRSHRAHQGGIYGIEQIDENRLWTLGGDGGLTVWDIPTMRPLETLSLSTQRLRGVARHPQGTTAAVAASDGNIYILDTTTLAVLQQLPQAHLPAVFTVAYTPDGAWLLSGGRDAMVCIWSVTEDYALHHKIPAHLATVNHLLVHPSGQYWATASRDKRVKWWGVGGDWSLLKVWDMEKGAGHLQSVNRLWWTKDGLWLLSASDDRTVREWRTLVGNLTQP